MLIYRSRIFEIWYNRVIMTTEA